MFKALKPRKASRVHERERLRRRHRCGLRDPSDLFELQMFRGTVPVGQYIYEANASFTVPSGVYRISMCCIGEAAITVNATVVCRSYGTTVGIGGNGGLGGVGGGNGSFPFGGGGGGGGCGGYDGDGGSGGGGGNTGTPPTNGTHAAANSGGGAGGAGSLSGVGTAGGGTGIKGKGSSGLGGDPGGGAGSGGTAGGDGPSAGKYGGGKAGSSGTPGVSGQAGANLRYANDIAVVPGQVVTIAVSQANWSSGARIIHGGNRSYPNNAGDL